MDDLIKTVRTKTTIQVDITTKKRLEELGKYTESLNDIIVRLLDNHARKR